MKFKELFNRVSRKPSQEDAVTVIDKPALAVVEARETPLETASMTSVADKLYTNYGESRYGYEDKKLGALAILPRTNEWSEEGFYTGIRQAHNPDGYIYGPGASNILNMLTAFSDTPKGIVMVDVNPTVIYFARMLTAALKQNPTVTEWEEAMSEGYTHTGSQNGTFNAIEQEVMDTVKDPHLKAQMEQHKGRITEYLGRGTVWPHYLTTGDMAKRDYYSDLRTLAQDDGIVAIHANMFDPELLRYVSELPGFENSNNLVYMSNVVDHIDRERVFWEGADSETLDERAAMVNVHTQGLNRLGPEYPHKNIFVDTTETGSLKYQLRSQTTVPMYQGEELCQGLVGF